MYLDQGYAEKLTTDQATICTGITNYIPHHCVSSKSKPDKIHVEFDASVKYNKSILHEHLLKVPDFSNNLVLVYNGATQDTF